MFLKRLGFNCFRTKIFFSQMQNPIVNSLLKMLAGRKNGKTYLVRFEKDPYRVREDAMINSN